MAKTKKRFYSKVKKFNGKTYRAVITNNGCNNCAFKNECDNSMFKYVGSCSPDDRDDKKDIIFIEVFEK